MNELAALIDDARAELNPSRTYTASLSMGSRLTYHLLDLHPDVAVDACLMACGNEADVKHLVRPALQGLTPRTRS